MVCSKNQQTYEIMRPETVGKHASRLVMGKHSGAAMLFRVRLEEMGYDNLSSEEINLALSVSNDWLTRKVFTDADIESHYC